MEQNTALINSVLEDPEKLELIDDLDLYDYLWKYLHTPCHGSTLPEKFMFEIASSDIPDEYLLGSLGCTQRVDEKTAKYLIQERSDLISSINHDILIDCYNSYSDLREIIRANLDSDAWKSIEKYINVDIEDGNIIRKIEKLLSNKDDDDRIYNKETYMTLKDLVTQLLEDKTIDNPTIDYSIFRHNIRERPWFHRIHTLFWNNNLFREEIKQAYEEDSMEPELHLYLIQDASIFSLEQVRKLIKS